MCASSLSAQVRECARREEKETYGGGLACLGLGSELLAGRLATGGLAGGLLSTSHLEKFKKVLRVK